MTNTLNDQMYALRFLANHAGLHDASTWLRMWGQDRKITNGDLARENYHRVKARDQVQYGTTDQLKEVAVMADTLGFTEAATFINDIFSK